MKKTSLVTLFSVALFQLITAQQITRFVDPFIGTGGHGHTYPGATLPFGMVQLSPDNLTQGWDWCSGYNYGDSVIAGFSHTHLSGTGIGDLADISIMPSVGFKSDTLPTPSGYSHSNEKASPGYYQVLLKDFGINAELTTGRYYGFHRYTFPQSEKATIRLDLGFAKNWDSPVECKLEQINDSTWVGWRFSNGWAKDQRVYFAIRLNRPVNQVKLFSEKLPVTGKIAKGKSVIGSWKFSTRANEVVLMKVGLSFGSTEGAIAALTEYEGWDFDVARQAAETIWEKELGKIKVEAKDPAMLKTFYTALYHTYLAPVSYSDILGNFRNTDGQPAHSMHPVYSVHSLWDTFRGANPLFSITQPQLIPDLINSYLVFYQNYGRLPVWDLMFNETNTMTGYHAVPVIADAILKNTKGFDYQLAFKAMKASAMQNDRGSEAYRRYGFLPQDKNGWSVTITLEYAFDDWCIAQVARKLGYPNDAQLFTKRAASYRPLFDAKTGFFRAKKSDGTWVEPFDPYYSEHGFNGMYIEGTAWQHTFFVPHAVNDYAALLGGKAKLIEKLDSLFTTTSAIHGDNVSNDISGLIGQYAHGNEPSHHIAYMYAMLGAPQKAAFRVRQILNTMYNATPNGLSGNEDCGQMSAWYVWSAIGMYPMNPASGQYVFGSPLVDKATINLPGGKTLEIVVKNNSTTAIVVRKATLNGRVLIHPYITHQQVQEGGRLVLEMGK